ncbi:cytochrome P450 704C1-like [Rutidosis leptorrhynchoides]|uniref:cytochrome P450 704C1-like n=1 Tax=Rutidosis leptorrhynchoides TaxID=125765 RepID=UPI003A9989C0
MKTLLLISIILSLIITSYFSTTFMPSLIALIGLFAIALLSYFLIPFFKEFIVSDDQRPPVVGSVFSMLIHFNHMFDYMTSIARKHHTFRFITPTHSIVHIADPINVEHILKSNFPNYTKGDNQKGLMRDLFGDGIFAADGDIWRHQRKLASYEFSTKNLRDFSTNVFRSNTTKLVKKISEAAVNNNNNIINLQDLLLKSTLDSIFKVGFGFDLNTLSGSDEVSNRFMIAFDDSNVVIFRRYVDVLWRVKRYFNFGVEASLKKNIKVIDNFVYELIQNKRSQMKNEKLDGSKEDVLSRFLTESETNPAKLSDRYLRDIVLSFIIAGKDTTANTLTWFFYMLCKNTFIQEKVALEVKEATGAEDDMCSIDEFSLKLTEPALEQMHYLHATLTETLRLYPPVPLDGKCAEKDDILPDGFMIKKGDAVSYMPYPMGRMTYIWGEDAEVFRPERWLRDGVFQPESPFKFTAFQAGPRICLGKEFAYRQMKIMSALLVYYFKFRLVDESKEATYRTMITLHMDNGLPLYAFYRSNI